jgi:hypothetical protein
MEAVKVVSGTNVSLTRVEDAGVFECLAGHAGLGDTVPTGKFANLLYSAGEFLVPMVVAFQLKKSQLVKKGFTKAGKIGLLKNKK